VIGGIAVCCVSVQLEAVFRVTYSNKRDLMFGFRLPWMDPLGNPGYYLNWVHHNLQVFYVFSILTGTIAANINLVLHAIGQINRLMLMLEHLDELCLSVTDLPTDREKQKKIKVFFGKIINYYQQHYR
jgi:hypothetical protein